MKDVFFIYWLILDIQIFPVQPSSVHALNGQEVPYIKNPYERSYAANNNVHIFTYVKPYRKNKTKGESQADMIKDVWTDNLFYVTKDVIPSITRRVEIVKRDVISVTPLENALKSMEEKNTEMNDMIKKYAKDRSLNTGQFTMALSGMMYFI